MDGGPTARLLIDEVMPRYDFREVHDCFVPAEPERAYAAAKTVPAAEIRLLGPLMAIRSLPATIARRRALRPSGRPVPVLDQFLRAGFVLLGERPGSELVAGAVGKFWSLSGNQPLEAVRTREDFVGFSDPGYAKAVFNLAVSPEGSGSRVTTETRIAGTDPTATKIFRRYWIVIRLPSGAIRRSWLNAIRRRAEAA